MVKRDFEGDLWPATRKRRWQRFASARTPVARWAEMSSSTRWSKRHGAVSRRRKAGVQAIRCRFRHKPDWYLKNDETTGTSRLHFSQNHQLLTLAKKKGDYRCAS